MKKWIGRLVMVLMLASIYSLRVGAQDPVTVIKEGVTKVIKAVDLQIQRIQTQTIFLEEAQKTVENAMSALDLDEIRDWVQQQKDLYAGYFQDLQQVKTVIGVYHRITEIIQRQEQILATYQGAIVLFRQDSHFTPDELAHMEAVYTGIVNESLRNLDKLFLVITSLTTQMTDTERMGMIDSAGKDMDRVYKNVNDFTNQNAELGMQRAAEAGDMDWLKKMYGL